MSMRIEWYTGTVDLPMSAEKKKEPTELERLEDALVDSILGMSETEIRDELRDAGQDPDLLIGEFDMLLRDVKSSCAVGPVNEQQMAVPSGVGWHGQACGGLRA